jgi:microcystin-dependent protein
MSDPFIGEIRMFGGNFAPAGWAMCSGQLMPIAENDALFQLIGTTYGGDGQSTFALPNLNGRVAVHQGSGFTIGQAAGVESVTLTGNQMPIHNHAVFTTAQAGTASAPSGTILADEGPAGITTPFAYAPIDSANQVQLRNNALANDGGGQPHDNLQPYLAVSFIISLFGVFPSQT